MANFDQKITYNSIDVYVRKSVMAVRDYTKDTIISIPDTLLQKHENLASIAQMLLLKAWFYFATQKNAMNAGTLEVVAAEHA